MGWRTGRNAAVWIVTIAAVLGLWDVVPQVGAQQDAPHVRGRGTASINATLGEVSQQQVDRLREGLILTDVVGTFVISGDRISFQMVDTDEPFLVLENLALERVWRMLNDTRDRQWNVSGRITEYRGGNYLLLHRAVLRSQAHAAVTRP